MLLGMKVKSNAVEASKDTYQCGFHHQKLMLGSELAQMTDTLSPNVGKPGKKIPLFAVDSHQLSRSELANEIMSKPADEIAAGV